MSGRNQNISVPQYEFEWSLAKKIMPLTAIYVGMLTMNNLCLQYVEITFYQVARSLSIPFNIAFTYLLLKRSTSGPAIIACMIMFVGFIMGSVGEMNFTWEGIIFGVGSSIFVALYGIWVKKALRHVNDNQWLAACFQKLFPDSI